MNKNKKTVLIVLVIFLLYLGATLALQPKIKSVLRVKEAAQPTPVSENPERVAYDCQPGQTVFDLLQKNAGGVEVKEYPFGNLVTTIKGLQGGTDGKFWTYFVDGQSATVSADSYQCQNSEKVEWKFEKAQ